jgi:hypothetical protein
VRTVQKNKLTRTSLVKLDDAVGSRVEKLTIDWRGATTRTSMQYNDRLRTGTTLFVIDCVYVANFQKTSGASFDGRVELTSLSHFSAFNSDERDTRPEGFC